MPELPDLTVYIDALAARLIGRTLERIVVRAPHLVRTADPPLESVEGASIVSVHRVHKRIVLELSGEHFLAIHLMIAGRLRWFDDAKKLPAGKIDEAALCFSPTATLMLTEASTQRRTAMHLVHGAAALAALDPGGLEPLTCTPAELHVALTRSNRTLKRALTDPTTLAGVGNAYSDEILHAAKMSPTARTGSLTLERTAALHRALVGVLSQWVRRLRAEFGIDPDLPMASPPDGTTLARLRARPGRFPGPGDITAFRPDFAAHGKYGKPCPVCGTAIARIIRGDHETNYCPRCQTGGKVLADRSLSRLLGDDWPDRVEDWE